MRYEINIEIDTYALNDDELTAVEERFHSILADAASSMQQIVGVGKVEVMDDSTTTVYSS